MLSKFQNLPFPDYKAPLAPKRELLAIHMGGVALTFKK